MGNLLTTNILKNIPPYTMVLPKSGCLYTNPIGITHKTTPMINDQKECPFNDPKYPESARMIIGFANSDG
jgi:hypothetical protein